MSLTLVIANKAYSSWSFRPWILMRHFEIVFEEITIPMAQATTHADMLRYAPTGKCPSLHDGDLTIWDSLSIIEYIAETFPEKAIWPRDKAARAQARSLSAEMHSGFMALRSLLPMNMRRKPANRSLTPEATADLERLESAFTIARQSFGRNGAFLMGDFSAVDAMFAPVINRLHAYDVDVSQLTRDYIDAMRALPAWQDWEAGARAESWIIDKYEVL